VSVDLQSKLSREEYALYTRLDPARLPRHVAIIMDGNGRWARKRFLPRIEGHRQGVKAARSTIRTASDVGIRALTLYAFSNENWKRPRNEVDFIMMLLQRSLRQELPDLKENNVRVSCIGRCHELPASVQDVIQMAREGTAECTGLRLNLALNYSAKAEIADAVNAALALRNGDRAPVTEDDIARHLYTSDLPELDLVIRTSGELRLSNFLLWQAAYAELYVTPLLWPEFGGASLIEAILDFQKRDRRFGGLSTDAGAAVVESAGKTTR
jgi:undecaprenyl diphosphate synthase